MSVQIIRNVNYLVTLIRTSVNHGITRYLYQLAGRADPDVFDGHRYRESVMVVIGNAVITLIHNGNGTWCSHHWMRTKMRNRRNAFNEATGRNSPDFLRIADEYSLKIDST